ncbi:MAG: hypothetical protein QM804_15865 [Propionicimonas sp.]
MSQALAPGAVKPQRWRPRWAFALAIGWLVVCAAAVGFGVLLVVTDLLRHDDFLDGVVALLGGFIALPGLISGIPLVVFLARRGGKVPFVLGLGLGIVAGTALVWFFNLNR